MDLRTWTDNPVKGENKKKFRLSPEQIKRAADIYHTWQNEGTDGMNYEEPELYRSVNADEIAQCGYSLVPSKYIRFIDRDMNIDFGAEMLRIQNVMRSVIEDERQSQNILQESFRGIGYGID